MTYFSYFFFPYLQVTENPETNFDGANLVRKKKKLVSSHKLVYK